MGFLISVGVARITKGHGFCGGTAADTHVDVARLREPDTRAVALRIAADQRSIDTFSEAFLLARRAFAAQHRVASRRGRAKPVVRHMYALISRCIASIRRAANRVRAGWPAPALAYPCRRIACFSTVTKFIVTTILISGTGGQNTALLFVTNLIGGTLAVIGRMQTAAIAGAAGIRSTGERITAVFRTGRTSLVAADIPRRAKIIVVAWRGIRRIITFAGFALHRIRTNIGIFRTVTGLNTLRTIGR